MRKSMDLMCRKKDLGRIAASQTYFLALRQDKEKSSIFLQKTYTTYTYALLSFGVLLRFCSFTFDN